MILLTGNGRETLFLKRMGEVKSIDTHQRKVVFGVNRVDDINITKKDGVLTLGGFLQVLAMTKIVIKRKLSNLLGIALCL
jgi:hypothetical protein